jgi:phosphoribosylamine--glycine ligase
VLDACLAGTLDALPPFGDGGARVCLVAAAPGYPGPVAAGLPIAGLAEAAAVPGVHVVQAGTRLDDAGQLVTAGGRVLGLVAEGRDVAEAAARAHAAIAPIRFGGEPPIHRSDLGRAGVEAGR